MAPVPGPTRNEHPTEHAGPAADDEGFAPGGLWARLGVRARVTLLFGLGALILSVTMGGLSYLTARHFLIDERQTASLHQAYLNAKLLRSTLRGTTPDIAFLLSAADSGTSGANSVLFFKGQWHVSSISVGENSIPATLRHLTMRGIPATQSFTLGGDPALAIGIPIPSVHAVYFEVFNLGDLRGTLRVLLLALVGAGVVTTILGAAVGRSASTRSLRPLAGVSRAAIAIADGQLDTRLPAAAGDPDLAGLSSSFNRMVDQLQERIEREERFTSDVSHELRSPLTTLSTTYGILEAHKSELTGSAQQALVLLGDDLRRFQRMVGDLLEMSRTDAGSADVSLEEVEAGELVRRSVTAAERTLPKDADLPLLEIDESIAKEHLAVDKRRFERVMTNLLENAQLYGGGATAVRAKAGPVRADGRATIWVSVEDRGAGVAPAERSRVFERFYRGQASGQRGTGQGSGLGLALVAEHVRLQGGAVWVDEAEGGGARFTVELPVSEEIPW